MREPRRRLEPPGAEGQQADAGNAVWHGMDLDQVAEQHQHAQQQRREADDSGEAIGRHAGLLPAASRSARTPSYSSSDSNPAAPTSFSKKRATFSAPIVVGQMVSMPRSA